MRRGSAEASSLRWEYVWIASEGDQSERGERGERESENMLGSVQCAVLVGISIRSEKTVL